MYPCVCVCVYTIYPNKLPFLDLASLVCTRSFSKTSSCRVFKVHSWVLVLVYSQRTVGLTKDIQTVWIPHQYLIKYRIQCLPRCYLEFSGYNAQLQPVYSGCYIPTNFRWIWTFIRRELRVLGCEGTLFVSDLGYGSYCYSTVIP